MPVPAGMYEVRVSALYPREVSAAPLYWCRGWCCTSIEIMCIPDANNCEPSHKVFQLEPRFPEDNHVSTVEMRKFKSCRPCSLDVAVVVRRAVPLGRFRTYENLTLAGRALRNRISSRPPARTFRQWR